MDLDAIAARAARHRLAILGGFHPAAGDCAPAGTATLLLLGPAEPGFWPHVTAQPEFDDGDADPLDRWSRRVVGALAAKLDAGAVFPFDGPPWAPFHLWARRTGRAWVSPVAFLVHDSAGLMVSFRGALALPGRIALPAPPAAAPCETCAEKPCLTACPVDAAGADIYDVYACHDFLDSGAGADCLSSGCAARRACPLSRSYGRLPEQSAYHMSRFHPE